MHSPVIKVEGDSSTIKLNVEFRHPGLTQEQIVKVFSALYSNLQLNHAASCRVSYFSC